MESLLTDRLAILSHPQRLAVFRLLMRRCPDELPAGEIADVLQLKASTASVYLSALTQAGLISQRRDATRLLYAVNLDAAREVVAGLFVDCCRGRADLCPPQFSDLLGNISPMAHKTFNVLFVCSGNSARSIIAETILRERVGDRFTAYSAGTAHRSELNPFAVEMLKSKGHDVSLLRSKNIAEFHGADAPRIDFVFTVCDHAANEDCPTWPGQPVSGHWGMPDPVKADGTDAEKRLAFHQTYGALHNRIMAFSALSFENLNRVSLQKCVDEIGKETANQE
ncbi:MAG: helix-turn-helix domain-containing protein [Planktomarina temperata]|uniref:arsenate reductase/protein-tyrosine-phosphatase family protein n=1 Tax=Planktomarina temperata TaxID=1284658 RepID=UPI0026FFD5FA|nr:helix-turn-helix domain-containing protein [Planktomarina temperata]MDO7623294.1 helix-turn-helix domain-containing protein [Loktanella sp.]MDO7625613.1 helix-turn-helix domain-containing protein [Loktanella sp.]MDO7664143.1 helix-turn-helix domain-containing protein [Loktanella sp.]MDO7683858.1 helix-turn-helix domain-containing protein [Loktanella sp.]